MIELLHGYEDLYDMAKGRYSDNCHKEKIWRMIGEELNKTGECALSLLLMKLCVIKLQVPSLLLTYKVLNYMFTSYVGKFTILSCFQRRQASNLPVGRCWTDRERVV